MKRILFSAMLLTTGTAFTQNAQINTQISTPASITIPEGTLIKVSINNAISGKEVEKGQKIDFTTTEDIIQGNLVVLKKGLKVVGTVTEAAKSKGLGKKGKLSFTIDYLYLENGKIVKLKSDVTKNLNGSGAIVATTAILISPLALFVHGKNAKYEKDEVFNAYIAENTVL